MKIMDECSMDCAELALALMADTIILVIYIHGCLDSAMHIMIPIIP
jgi:hypothetical protein